MLLILTVFLAFGRAGFEDAVEFSATFETPSIVGASFVIDNCVAPELGSLCDSKDEIDRSIDDQRGSKNEETTSSSGKTAEQIREHDLEHLRKQGCYIADDGSFRWCQVSRNNIVQLCQSAFPELKQENGTAAETVAHGDAFSVTFNYPLLTSSVKLDGSQFWLFISDSEGYSHRHPFCALPSPLTGKRDAYSVQLFFPRHDTHVGTPLKLHVAQNSDLTLMGPNGALLDASGMTFLKDEDALTLPNGETVDLMAWETGQWLRMAKLFPFSLRGERLSDKNIHVQALTEKGQVFEGYNADKDQEIPKDARVYPNHCRAQYPKTKYVLRLVFIGEPSYDGVHPLTSNHTDWIHIYLKDGSRWQSENILGIKDPPKVRNHLFELSDGDNIIDICLGDMSWRTFRDLSHVYLPCGDERPIYLPKGGDTCVEHKVPIVASVEATGFEDFTTFAEVSAHEDCFKPAELVPDEEFQSCKEAPFCFGTALPGDFPNHGPYVSNRLFYARESDTLSCGHKRSSGWCERLASYQCWFQTENESPCPQGEHKCKYNNTEFMRNDHVQNVSSLTLGCGACEWCANVSGSNAAYWLDHGSEDIQHGFPEAAFWMIAVCVGVCLICMIGTACMNSAESLWGEKGEESQSLLGDMDASMLSHREKSASLVESNHSPSEDRQSKASSKEGERDIEESRNSEEESRNSPSVPDQDL